MKLLTYTTLYPNAIQPQHGVFVENRLCHLLQRGEVDAEVMAPVPWFPSSARWFGRYGDFARVPEREERFEVPVRHPRFLSIPKVGMRWGPELLYRGTRRAAESVIAQGHNFDLIDAHYFYPDGVAAVKLGEHLGKPVVVTARGTDLNLISRYRGPRRLIQWAAGRAAGLVTVSAALKDRLVELGVDADRVTVLRNGVDSGVFRPLDREALRQKHKLDRATLVSVGNLVPLKGHDLVISALRQLPETDLLIVGDGPERGALAAYAESHGVGHRVRFRGRIPHAQMAEFYSVADILVLASSREGWANVLPEAMACGTPVVATRVGSTPEIVTAPEAGRLARERTPGALANEVQAMIGNPPSRAATRAFAEKFTWDETTQGQISLFEKILSRRAAA